MTRGARALVALAGCILAVFPATGVAWPNDSAHRLMFPRAVIVRGLGLARPVVITHDDGGNFRQDPIVRIYDFLTPAAELRLSRLELEPHYEVAEFFRFPSSSGSPRQEWRFDQADHLSRLYPATRTRPAIWDDPVVRPSGLGGRYFVLGATAIAVLASFGITLQAPPHRRGR